MNKKRPQARKHEPDFWILVCLFGAIALSCLYTLVNYFVNVRPYQLTEQNLLQVGMACKNYAYQNENEFWPPVAFQPRPFTLDPSVLDPELATPSDLESPVLAARKRPFGGRSFYYLGYAVANEEAGLAWLEAVRAMGAESLEPFADIKTDSQSFFALCENVNYKMIEDFERREIEADMRRFQSHRIPEEPLASFGARMREWIIGTAHATSWNLGPSRIPVLVEHPAIFGDGGHVLYLDGHVKFLDYPSKFPMTERFIAALESMETQSP